MGDHEASLTQWEQRASGCAVGFVPGGSVCVSITLMQVGLRLCIAELPGINNVVGRSPASITQVHSLAVVRADGVREQHVGARSCR